MLIRSIIAHETTIVNMRPPLFSAFFSVPGGESIEEIRLLIRASLNVAGKTPHNTHEKLDNMGSLLYIIKIYE
jgi:hypothetical protein